jgi:hypothetical protein
MSNVRWSGSSHGQRQVSMSQIPSSLDHRRRDLSFRQVPAAISEFSRSTDTISLMFTLSRTQSTDILARNWRAARGAGSAYVGDPREESATSDAKDQRPKKKRSAAAGLGGRTP